jgi:hypothetical protein
MPVSVKFLLAALATWRVAFLLVREEGPGGVLANAEYRFSDIARVQPVAPRDAVAIVQDRLFRVEGVEEIASL